ncbi:hypothetical protein KC338_g4903 [Hortaea werneckii]|nr:hypothetical protein KC323_g8824 [Hortaea werneckii]KAI6865973.1 hypothetical protein KC338_g4903 [Hortaea werneckii]KAI7356220.1 hypothetical protein KC320_g2357 [Hortaea werneckii]
MADDVKGEVMSSSPVGHEDATINDSSLHSVMTDIAEASNNESEKSVLLPNITDSAKPSNNESKDTCVAKADYESDSLFLPDDEDAVKAEDLSDRATNEAQSREEVKVDNKAYDHANVQHLPATAVMTTTTPKLDRAAYDQANVQRMLETAVSTTTPLKRTKTEQVDTTLQISSRKKSKASTNRTPPYDDKWEKESSRLAVDQECFGKAESLVPVICDVVTAKADALRSKGYNDEEIVNIAKKLKDLRFVGKSYPRSKPTGCLGVTAAGKSTLMNCLISQENIAAECDEGESGTSVIQELVMAEVDQIETFKAVVYYHPNRKIEAFVKRHFQTIHDFQNLDTEDLDADEYSAWQADYETALTFFYTLLCERDEFMSADATLAYLNSATSRDDDVMLGQLSTWILEYLTRLKGGEGATVVQANTMREVNRELAKFKGPAKTGIAARSASPWPLVRIIKTHLQARILSEGAVLADLPGLSDTNKLRVQATRDYIKNCDTVIIVHPILRIQSQDTVWKEVHECIRNGKQGNLIIVCTKVDDIKHSRERDVSSDDRKVLEKLRKEADDLAAEIAELEDKLQDAEENEDADYRSINRRLKATKTMRAGKEAEWREENIAIRNRRNIDAIQAGFRKAVNDPDANVPVFCVSNTIYQQHMKGFDNDNPPDLTVEATGIPDLRKHLFEIPAKRKHRALQKLGQRTLPRVLLALEMQCCKTRLERKQDIECKVVKPLNDFKDELHTLKARLKRNYEAAMQKTLQAHESEWYEAAKALHVRWIKYKYAAKYFAFCRHNGDWKDPSKNDVQWNGLITDVVADDMMASFNDVKEAFDEIRDDFKHKLDVLLTELDTDLHDSPQLMGMNLDSLHKVIALTQAAVDDKANKLFRKLDININNFRYNATSIEPTTSYVGSSMQVAYDNCKACKGAGVFNSIKHIISQKLTGPKNVFLDVQGKAIAEFEDYVDLWITIVDNKIGAEFQAVIDDFNGRFVDVEEEDETKHGFRNELLQTVQKALAMADTELKAELDACDEFD